MTTANERTQAVLDTREFLIALAHPRSESDVPKEIRGRAEILLRHYPSTGDMQIVGLACPIWYGMPNTGIKFDTKNMVYAIDERRGNTVFDWLVNNASWILYAIAAVTALAGAALVFILLKNIH
ncbi:BPSL0761 family protein [Noviherbaspirillum pedocola]|uniref:Uncharacterized protein n=1 Tax=Noviherbaspirillum pedocola TaxID=2801341 RepID=A0A934T1J6_9BURK|nr:BPSL0761 family protein [Noviherbaspirillum pedocola]MBK4737327.1 hypothetical protein [Noviherbaspirillum pedocola]